MAEETQIAETPNKRRNLTKKNTKASIARKKKSKKMPHKSDGGNRATKPKKIDSKMKKLYRKRAREYDSDEEKEEENEESDGSDEEEEEKEAKERRAAENGSDEEEEDGDVQLGITKLSEGSNAFRLAFRSIVQKNVADDALGPIFAGNRKLIAEKLAEADAERKVKGEAKDRQLVIEKGHVVSPVNINPHEKFLISLATRGVVTLFNAVSKAQHAQKGLDPSRFKDAKVIKKRRKEAFFSELGKSQSSKGSAENEGPAWAPLRDTFMLTNPKLKDWDKKQDQVAKDGIGRMSEDSSSDDE